MQLIFCMLGNIKVFNKLILSFLTGVASLPKIPKIKSLQYLTNHMLDYLYFKYAIDLLTMRVIYYINVNQRLLQMIIFI